MKGSTQNSILTSHANAPKITDENTPGVSIELPDVWKTILEKASSNGRVMTQDEFFKEFGRYEK